MQWDLLGTRVVGPFQAGSSINIRMATEDAESAGFTVDLFDAQSGEPVKNLFANYDSETKKAINEIETEVSVTLSGSGSYFLAVAANRLCQWQVHVSE